MLKVGAAQAVITPKVGCQLFGYTYDTFSESVNDDLTATAIAFIDGEKKILAVSATVCEISTDFALEVREKVAEAIGFDFSDIMLSATHTHSGPVTATMEGWGVVDRDYADNIFIPNIIKAAVEAVENVKSAKVGVSVVQSQVGVNRRQLNRENFVDFGQNPWGLYDPNMTFIAIKDEDGKGIVNIIHYGAHCTAAGRNHEISRDWAGVMLDCVDRETNTITAFFNGAEGDVGPRISNGLTTGDLRYVRELGGVAAIDAMRAYRAIKEYRPMELKIAKDKVSLPYKKPFALDDAKAVLAKYPEKPAHNLERMQYVTMEQIIDYYNSGKEFPSHKEFDQTVFAIGDIVFVPFPFEFFSEISLRLREYSKYQYTLGIGCTNGVNAYLPSQTELCRGGYEVAMFLYNGVTSLADDSDINIINENLRIMEKLK